METTMGSISLVTTVLNDYQGVIDFFTEIEAQTILPNEIIIVDGGSTDGTWDFLQHQAANSRIPLQVYSEPGCNVARGRNLAIQRAKFDLIASTDIGCNFDPEWLEELVAPLITDPTVDYVVGSWAVQPQTIQTPWGKTELVMRGGHIFQATPDADATSRSIAYHKQTWEVVGGYPEDLTLAADDTVFMILLKKRHLKAAAAPNVRCYWHRFGKLRQFLKEERRNFFGDGEALIRRKHIVLVGGRLLVELLCILSILFALLQPSFYLGLAASVLLAVSVTHRVVRFLPKAQTLAQKNVSFPLLRLLTFDFLTKLWSLQGYFKGMMRGNRFCQDCRTRVHQMNIVT
jgi:glycosyltransferase involved in cell wall biosynthesis